MVYKSQTPDFNIPDVDLYSFLMQGNDKLDKIVSIQGETGASMTRGEIKDRASRLAAGWKHNLGLGKGDVVAVFAPNQYDHIVLYLSLFATGAAVSPGNPGYTPAEFLHQISNSGANTLVTVPALLPVLLKIADKVGIKHERIFVFGQKEDNGIRPFYSLLPKDDSRITGPIPDIVPSEDVAVICYSSGTTGVAKGVALTHRNVVGQVIITTNFDPKSQLEDDVLIQFLPLFHVFGMCVCLNNFFKGNKSVAMMRFDLELYLKLIQQHKATSLAIVPPIAVLLSKHPLVRKFDLSSVRIFSSGAAPLGPEHVANLKKVVPQAQIRQGYGMTETSAGVIGQKAAEAVPGSIGTLLANNEAKLIDENGNEVGDDQRGELLIRGVSIMKHYHKNPQATADTLTKDGWLATGDVAVFDSKTKQFFIVDRIKELIKVKGMQVAPAELEAVLLGNEKIADCAVVGVYDAKDATEYPRAYVVLQVGVEKSPAMAKEIADYVAGRLINYKQLRGGVRFVPAIPKSAAGKLLRKDIKQWIKDEQAKEQTAAKL
ncbi:hypothetical protein BC940DRAFT_363995 [Gongronella butleri]|nr:hypothetical protein BC940DRAFT_363995 [Gongronella butleri]